MFQINPNISTGSHGPERRFKLLVMNPDLHVFAVDELVEAAGVVEVEVADDTTQGGEFASTEPSERGGKEVHLHFFDFLKGVARGFDCCSEFVARLVADTREDVGDCTPDCWVIFAAASLELVNACFSCLSLLVYAYLPQYETWRKCQRRRISHANGLTWMYLHEDVQSKRSTRAARGACSQTPYLYCYRDSCFRLW